MLLKAAQVIQTTNPLIFKGTAGFSHRREYEYPSQPFPKIDQKLLYPFDKENTLKALESVTEKSDFLIEPNSKDFITLDKLSHTGSSSITHRMLDKTQKKFYAVKTLDLKSENSLKQVNLALRTHGKDGLLMVRPAKATAFEFDQSAKEAKIITEIPKKTLADSFDPLMTWTNEELKAFLAQILMQINALKHWNAYCNYISPQNFYVDEEMKILKLYDFSGFEVESSKMKNLFGFYDRRVNFEAAVDLLARITSDRFSTDGNIDARYHFQTKYPDFLPELDRIEHDTRLLSAGFGKSSFENSILNRSQILSTHPVFDRKTFNRGSLNNIHSILVSKDPFNFIENRALINQILERYDESLLDYNKALNENISRNGYNHESTLRNYVNIAEVYHSKGDKSAPLYYFRRAVDLSQSLWQPDDILIARLYNNYGKFLMHQDQYADAFECFEKAEEAMERAPIKKKDLAFEIQSYLEITQDAHKLRKRNFVNEFISNWDDFTHTEKYSKEFKNFGCFTGKVDWKSFNWNQCSKTSSCNKSSQDQWNDSTKDQRWSSWCRGSGVCSQYYSNSCGPLYRVAGFTMRMIKTMFLLWIAFVGVSALIGLTVFWLYKSGKSQEKKGKTVIQNPKVEQDVKEQKDLKVVKPEVSRKEVKQDRDAYPPGMLKIEVKQLPAKEEDNSSGNKQEVPKTTSVNEGKLGTQVKENGNFIWFSIVAMLASAGLLV